jgi:protein-tyrosine phosphatase
MQRAELHFHLLPGVDDGPVDLDGTIELARLAVADGTSLVTVTPHVHELMRAGILDEIPARVRDTQAALDEAGVPLEVQVGGEIGHPEVARLDDRRLDAIAHGPPGRRWVLIEAPLLGDATGFLDATAELRARGFGTLIGHPERCTELMEIDGAVARERAAGAVLQVNASSLTGFHGPTAQAYGLELLRAGEVDVISSDAHGVSRPPRLAEALDVLADAGFSRADVEPLASAGPRALLDRGIAPLRRAA